MRCAEARLKASSMSRSSIKLLLPGAEVDCRTNTSAPRTFSLISTLLSPSLKVSTVALPNGTLRYWLISAASGGLEFPAKIFRSAVRPMLPTTPTVQVNLFLTPSTSTAKKQERRPSVNGATQLLLNLYRKGQPAKLRMKNWLGGKDSNLRYRLQRPGPYRLATAHP